jgi:Fic family protein
MNVYQDENWPNWDWNENEVNKTLVNVVAKQNQLLGKLSILGFDVKEKTALETGILDVLNNSKIEGENLKEAHVRSSIAKNFGIEIAENDDTKSESTEGAVNLFLDSIRNYNSEIKVERLFDWHAGLFPTGRSAGRKIDVAKWRTSLDPMQIVSGPMGREVVHYEAPKSESVSVMMNQLINYVNKNEDHPYIKAAIAHLWFEIIHPFDDGNGRIGRAIVDLLLCRADEIDFRYYSFSNTILNLKKEYYALLNKMSKGDLNITEWINWFLNVISKSIKNSEIILTKVDFKRRFWEKNFREQLNIRQRKVIEKLLEGFEGNITSSKWSRITSCTRMTATRDINDLIEMGILIKTTSGGRSTAYILVDDI